MRIKSRRELENEFQRVFENVNTNTLSNLETYRLLINLGEYLEGKTLVDF